MVKMSRLGILYVIVLLGGVLTGNTQNCQVRGWVKALDSGEPLIGATVYSPTETQGVYSNSDGYFLLPLSCEGGIAVIQQLGFIPDTVHIPVGTRDTFVTISMRTQMLQTVVVTTSRVADLPGKISVPVEKLKAMPALLGEMDIFRSLQRLPGISNAVEGTTGLVVRGGAIDQNLILLDGSTLYNNGHVFGFISAINPAVVKHVDVYTGYIPAKYAGRLSSVVDIHTKDGDKTKRKREVSLGSINSSCTLEGAMGQSGRNSYLVSTRMAHSGLLTLATLPRYARGNALLFAGMYDVNAKLSWEGDHANKLSLSVYAGDDFWGATSKAQSQVSTSILTWGNKAVSLRYVRPKGHKAWVTTLLGYNRYGNRLKSIGVVRSEDLPESRSEFASKGRIEEYRLHHIYQWTFGTGRTLALGAEAIRQVFLPASVRIQAGREDVLRLRPVIDTWTGGIFVNHALPLGRDLTFHTDLRLSAYVSRSLYLPWLEPRLSVNYQLSDHRKIFAAYSRTRQPLHLVTFNGNTYPYATGCPPLRHNGPKQREYLIWATKNNVEFGGSRWRLFTNR
ncbi:MAG: carboxypeptidase-like regulatory domain-containing protein [Saprospiraceae bacterium]